MTTKRTKKLVPKPVEEALVDALKEQFPDAFKPELIDGVDVEEAAKDVLLSVAYTPVIPDRFGIIPCVVVELDSCAPTNAKNYRIYYPDDYPTPGKPETEDVTDEELRVMRARFLLTKTNLYAHFDKLTPEAQDGVARMYFGGRRPFIPSAGSRIANIPAGGLSIQLKAGQTHAQLFEELMREAGATDDEMTVAIMPGPNETAQAMAARLGFPVPSPELQDARSRLLGVLASAPSTRAEPSPAAPQTKPAGRPRRKKNQQDTLPIAESYYSVTQLPAVTAPSPNPALRSSEGMVRAVFAVWYSSVKPDIAALEPPDELGCFVGAQCAVEAQTTADRLIRLRKGPRSFAWPLSEAYAQTVYTDGIRQRTTALTLGGRQAMAELGLRSDDATLTDVDVQAAYRRMVADGRLHPDQGGTNEQFERITGIRDIALEYVRAMGEAHGRAGQSNEEREASTTLGLKAREFLCCWAKGQRDKGDLEKKPHMTTPANKTMGAIIRTLVKRGYARLVMEDMFVLTAEGMAHAAGLDQKVGKATEIANEHVP